MLGLSGSLVGVYLCYTQPICDGCTHFEVSMQYQSVTVLRPAHGRFSGFFIG
jgi:hypothetical protein